MEKQKKKLKESNLPLHNKALDMGPTGIEVFTLQLPAMSPTCTIADMDSFLEVGALFDIISPSRLKYPHSFSTTHNAAHCGRYLRSPLPLFHPSELKVTHRN